MKTRKLFAVCLVLVLAAAVVLVAACNREHKHNYTEWAHNDTQHWKVCPQDNEIDETSRASHNFGADNKCECGATKSNGGGGSTDEEEWEHEYCEIEWQYDAMQHWVYCHDHQEVDMSTYAPHKFVNGKCTQEGCDAQEHTEHTYTVWAYDADNHWKKCSICGLKDETTVEEHTFTDKVCKCGAINESFSEIPTPRPGAEYVLVGDFSGGTWNDASVPFEKEGSTYTITQDFAAGQKWKAKKVNVDWNEWEINFSTRRNITVAPGVQGDVQNLLFTNDTDGNIVCKYACTLTISHNGTASSVDIRVDSATDVPANGTLYTYTFHIYAPSWSGAYIHGWGGLLKTDWDSKPEMKSDGGGWYSYTVSSYDDKSGVTDQGVVICDKNYDGNRVTMGGDDEGAGDWVKVAQDMWFNCLEGNKQFDSKDEALNGAATIAITSVQVATLPPQNAVGKYSFAA